MKERSHTVPAGNTCKNACYRQTVNNQLSLALVKIAVFRTYYIAGLSTYRVPAIYVFRQACQFAFSFINLYLSALALLFNNNTSNLCL